MATEFKFLGNNMEKISSYYGIFLIIWGFAVSYVSNSESLTSLIPTFLGILILVFALFALFIPSKKKLFMHIVVIFGLITFIGGLDLIRNYNSLFNNFWGDLSKFALESKRNELINTSLLKRDISFLNYGSHTGEY